MVYRPGSQAPQPTHLAGAFTVAAALPPMHDIKDQAAKDGIRAQSTNAMVDQINTLILAENMTGTVKIDNDCPAMGRALLHCTNDDFKDKIAALSTVKSVDPVVLLYPMSKPGINPRKLKP